MTTSSVEEADHARVDVVSAGGVRRVGEWPTPHLLNSRWRNRSCLSR